jgi:RNA polymerase sigma-70 factor, ECF subfamily
MLSEQEILQALMNARTRVSAAAWVVVRDAHAAEDIFQNVVLKAMTRDMRCDSEGALLSWSFITARREGLDWLRRHRREVVGLDPDILDLLEQDWSSMPAEGSCGKTDALRECLESVPESARRLLRLRYYEGHSCQEVAVRTGIGLNAIYKRVSRLHVSLKECIEGKLGQRAEPS